MIYRCDVRKYQFVHALIMTVIRIVVKTLFSVAYLANGDLVGFGIYELVDGSLKLIVCKPNAERPTELKGAPDAVLFLLARE